MSVLEHMKLYNPIHEKKYPLHKNYSRWKHIIESIFFSLIIIALLKEKGAKQEKKEDNMLRVA